ncbi:MAG: hypothetical protein U9N85_05600, partial [Bacteroidota bacterium]|nr:hypothetical protein [Bacteroidota bacterium]
RPKKMATEKKTDKEEVQEEVQEETQEEVQEETQEEAKETGEVVIVAEINSALRSLETLEKSNLLQPGTTYRVTHKQVGLFCKVN